MKRIIIVIISFSILSYLVVTVLKKSYHDQMYLMSLNGKIERIRVDIKDREYITVSNKEYDLAHFWPNLQKQAEVGDSVYKKINEYPIVLVKFNTNQRINCAFK